MAETDEPTVPQAAAEEMALTSQTVSQGENDLSGWQGRLLPFMQYMVVGLAIFFFVASFGQLVFLHGRIFEGTSVGSRVLPDLVSLETLATSDQVLNAGRFQALASLELYLLERRYHQANVALMARVWVRYLGFVTGMILALVGATFILGKLREPPTKGSAELVAGKFSFEGTSPGMFLVLVGVILMLTTIVVHHEISVIDGPVFTRQGAYGAGIPTGILEPDRTPILPLPTLPSWPEDPGTGGDGMPND